MIFKVYLKFYLPIFIQHVIELGETETRVLEALIVIWKIITEMNNNSFVLSWHPKSKETLRPLKSIDLVKVMSRKKLYDKDIEIFANGMVRFK